MIAVVYAMGTNFVDLTTGQRVQVVKGSHWPADDPVVRQAPHMFSTDPRWGMFYSVEPRGYDAPIGDEDYPVELASAAPGEKRSVRRG